jgi:formate dehydrogenase subunit gamma
MSTPKQIPRYSDNERFNHWLTAIAFVLSALSGLALFHPALFWLSNLFGGGAWTRILHPFIGLVMAIVFVGMMVRFWHHNLMQANDRQWIRQWRDAISNREELLPEVGRYNAGQKMIFWLMVVCITTLLVTGILFWRPWFADAFPIVVVRIATLLHAVAATVLILGAIVHIYAAIWVKGSLGGMMRGTVSEKWARKHHPAWLREITGK